MANSSGQPQGLRQFLVDWKSGFYTKVIGHLSNEFKYPKFSIPYKMVVVAQTQSVRLACERTRFEPRPGQPIAVGKLSLHELINMRQRERELEIKVQSDEY